MKKQLFLGSLLLLGHGQLAGAAPEKYAAVAVGTGGNIGGQTLSLDIHIDQYTSDAEAKELADLLAEQGQDALRRRLEQISKGKISPVGRVGNDISVIRSQPTDKGKRIVLVSARVMPWVEMYVGGRSTQYNLSWVVLELDQEGKGTGSVILGAKLQFDEEGKLDVTSYGRQFVKLVNVRPWK
jgi:hypothetical protein